TAKRSSYKRNAFVGQLSVHHGAELDVAIAWIRSNAANTIKTPKTWNSRSDISTRLSSHPIGRPATASISTNVTMMKIPSRILRPSIFDVLGASRLLDGGGTGGREVHLARPERGRIDRDRDRYPGDLDC